MQPILLFQLFYMARFMLLFRNARLSRRAAKEGKVTSMPNAEDRAASLMLIGLPLMLVLACTIAQVLPLKVSLVLTAWTLFSLPLGIAVGHCALRED
jgi:hypothetical protein